MQPDPSSGSTDATPSIVALTGFMGAGKSTVGRSLANLLQWCFVDLDREIERLEGKAIRDIFASLGEVEFRRIENQTLRNTLSEAVSPTVIALGGGTFSQLENARLLESRRAQVIFLEVNLEILLQRCSGATARCGVNPRPLAQDEGAFRALYRQRLPTYRTAGLTIVAEGSSPDQCAARIAKALRLAPISG